MPLFLAVWKGRSKIFWWSCIRSWLERIPYQVNQFKLQEKTIKGITTLKLKEPKTIACNQIKSAKYVDLFLHNRRNKKKSFCSFNTGHCL